MNKVSRREMVDRFLIGGVHGEGFNNARQNHMSVTLANPNMLNCCICKKALPIPTVQCQNGHVACSVCCVARRRKCPICSEPIGEDRCRAFDSVLESFKISCQNARFGCESIIPYHKQIDHKKQCIYAPCVCPHPSCTFVAISKRLALHFIGKHTGSAVLFLYGRAFSVKINACDKTIILKEQNDGSLFVVSNDVVKGQKYRVSVHCVGPNSCNPAFHYELHAKSYVYAQKMISVMPNHQSHIAYTPAYGFLPIPSNVFDCGQLKLDLCIKIGDSFKIYLDLSAE